MRQMMGISSCSEANAKLGSLSETQNRSVIRSPKSYKEDKSD